MKEIDVVERKSSTTITGCQELRVIIFDSRVSDRAFFRYIEKMM